MTIFWIGTDLDWDLEQLNGFFDSSFQEDNFILQLTERNEEKRQKYPDISTWKNNCENRSKNEILEFLFCFSFRYVTLRNWKHCND